MDQNLRKILSENYTSNEKASIAIDNYNPIKYLEQTPAIKRTVIYTDNKSIPSSKIIKHIDSKIEEQSWYTTTCNSSVNHWKVSDIKFNKADTQNYFLVLYKKIPLPLSDHIAILEIVLDNNFIANRLNSLDYSYILNLNQKDIFLISHNIENHTDIDSSTKDSYSFLSNFSKINNFSKKKNYL